MVNFAENSVEASPKRSKSPFHSKVSSTSLCNMQTFPGTIKIILWMTNWIKFLPRASDIGLELLERSSWC